MIEIKKDLIVLHTMNTTYCMCVNEIGYLEHVYYGKRMEIEKKDIEHLLPKTEFTPGNGIYYDEEHPTISLENRLLEYSTLGKGDPRNPLLDIRHLNGSRTTDLHFVSAKKRKHVEMEELPHSRGEVEEVVIHLEDKVTQVDVNLIFAVFEECDVITRRMEVKNKSKEKKELLQAFSLQLDMLNENYEFVSFHGGWASEMNKYVQECKMGRYISETLTGVSSSKSNPFVMIQEKGCRENSGKAYGFNLIYSGNHQEAVEVDFYKHLRFLSGINPTTFSKDLAPGEEFKTPEAIMSYSDTGLNNLSHHFHDFVNNHIIDPNYRGIPRPVLINSWEANYFKFNEAKLISMAKTAKSYGIEMFVLDDGWFGKRDNDTSSLGDWFENKKKLRNNIVGLSKAIHKLGMSFGIWVEPECVNENSELFRKHPEWALRIKDEPHSLGRNQMILDLTNDDVVNYIIDSMVYVFGQHVDYVKWDFNRVFSDYYSQTLEPSKMKELNHLYYLGFYKIISTLKKKYPHILFEGCAAGGNRFDLGILYYYPQIWASDNSNSSSRVIMQRNYSYGYPISTLGCHVSAIPNHQTLRKERFSTRFGVAFFGNLGYELNINELSNNAKKSVRNQVATYKEYQDIVYGDFYRSDDNPNDVTFFAVTKNKEKAAALHYQLQFIPGEYEDKLKVYDLNPKFNYHVRSKNKEHSILMFGGLINMISPIHLNPNGGLVKLADLVYKLKETGLNYYSTGDKLNNNGIFLRPAYIGTGENEKTRVMTDNDARLVLIKKKD